MQTGKAKSRAGGKSHALLISRGFSRKKRARHCRNSHRKASRRAQSKHIDAIADFHSVNPVKSNRCTRVGIAAAAIVFQEKNVRADATITPSRTTGTNSSRVGDVTIGEEG